MFLRYQRKQWHQVVPFQIAVLSRSPSLPWAWQWTTLYYVGLRNKCGYFVYLNVCLIEDVRICACVCVVSSVYICLMTIYREECEWYIYSFVLLPCLVMIPSSCVKSVFSFDSGCVSLTLCCSIPHSLINVAKLLLLLKFIQLKILDLSPHMWFCIWPVCILYILE